MVSRPVIDEWPRVALVRMLGDDRLDSNTADYNVGLLYLAASLGKVGVRATVFDPLAPSQLALLTEPDELSLVGFTVHYLNIQETLVAAQRVKESNPSCTVILGGHHASATATELLADNPFIDGICIG